MVTIYNTTLSATSQRYFSDSLGGRKYMKAQWTLYITIPFVPRCR